jgi:hypothetical protein
MAIGGVASGIPLAGGRGACSSQRQPMSHVSSVVTEGRINGRSALSIWVQGAGDDGRLLGVVRASGSLVLGAGGLLLAPRTSGQRAAPAM